MTTYFSFICKFDHTHDWRCPTGCSVVRHVAAKTTPRGTAWIRCERSFICVQLLLSHRYELQYTNYPRRHSRRRGYSVQSRLSVCLFDRALTGKRLELSTPNFVHVYSIAVALHALTQRSKGQRSRSHDYVDRHGRTVASDRVQYFAYPYAAVRPLPAWVNLHVDTTAYVF